MTRALFTQQLSDIRLELLKMAAFTINALNDSFRALAAGDVNHAKVIVEHDEIANTMELDIEHKCLSIIAREQPIAKDLRVLTVTLKIISDLERICDHAADISKIVIRLKNEKYEAYLSMLDEMIATAKGMVKDAVDAYTYQDLELAQKVCKDDDVIDNGFQDLFEKLNGLIKEHLNDINCLTHLLLVAKYLERIGDHATNIAEWAVFNITGIHEQMD